jgi:diadenosine tetraphosphate (Ap4A) HIT family hydrolase
VATTSATVRRRSGSNRFPYSSGHLLIAPYRHTGDFVGLEEGEVAEIHALGAAGVRALGEVHAPEGFNVKVLPEHLEATCRKLADPWRI